jgi:hypothetical protein
LRQELNLSAKEILNLKTSDEWMDRLTDFLHELSDLLEEKVKDEDLIEYGERLVIARSRLAKFNYVVRRFRNESLAKGYERYPRGDYNSDASTALARQFASEEVRLRELCRELEQALDMRFELNRSAISTARAIMQHA